MASNVTNDATTQEVNNVLSKDFIKRNLYASVFEKYATLSEDIPKNKGQVIKWVKYARLTPKTTAATEGTTPTASTVTRTNVTATVAQYIDWVRHTDKVEYTAESKPLQQTNKLLAEEAAEIKDILCMNALFSGAGTTYDITTWSAANIDTQIDLVLAAFRGDRVKPVKSMLDGSPKYGSRAVPASYILFCDATDEISIRSLDDFKSVEEYSNTGNLAVNEIGMLTRGVRVVRSDHSMQDLAGSSKAAIIIIGADALAVTAISGHNTEMIVKPLGYGDDPANQRGSQAFKMLYVAKVLNGDNVAVIQDTSS